MKRWLALLFWAFSCSASLLALVYLAGFVHNRYSFSTVDSGLQIPEQEAALVDVALLALFGLQHSGMARQWWKRRALPPAFERSAYLLATALVLLLIYVRWEPIPVPVWRFETTWPFRAALALAGVIVVWSAAAQGALHFLGFHQAWSYFRGRPYEPPAFKAPGLYRYSRHPMMIGTLLFLWASPVMTRGHLLFSTVLSLYILLAVRWEERDLERIHGTAFADYRQAVSRWLSLLPPGR